MGIKAENRLPMFDELRGIAIICVIAIHTAAHDLSFITTSVDYWVLVVQTMLCRFAVPSFLIISGFFVSYKEQTSSSTKVKNNMIRRMRRVALPYVIWSSIYFLFFLVTGVQFSRNPAIIFFEKLATGTVVFHLYFLVLIIQMYVLSCFGFMKNGHTGKAVIVFAVAAFLLFSIPSYVITIRAALAGSGGGYYFSAYERSLAPRWLLFFMLGRWMGFYWDEVKKFSSEHRRLLSAGVCSSAVLCGLDFFCLRLFSGKLHLLPPDWMISCLLFGSLFPIWFLTLPMRANLILKWLGKLGKVSFGVYLLHEPFLSLLMVSNFWQSCAGILSNALIRQLVSILVGLVASLLMLAVLQRSLPTRIRRYVLE